MSSTSTAEFPDQLRERFRPEGVLGVGAHGAVYRALDLELERPVAVKVYRMEASAAARFARETTRLASLRHENLVAVYAAGVTAGGPYLVMELVEGEPLSTAARRPGFDALPPLLGVADALEAVHRAGLVHRDVKPQNIMVTPDGRGVLLDFGWVHDARAETLTESGVILGSAGYMTPEAFRGAPPEPSWDWYGWGACLYACHQGTPPFTVAHLMSYGRGEELPALLGIESWPEPRQGEVVRRCLDPDDRVRPGSRRQIEDLLAGAPGDRSPTSGSTALGSRPLPRRAQRPRHGRPWWVLGVAGVALACGWFLTDPVEPPGERGIAAPTPATASPPTALRRRPRGGPLILPLPDSPPSASLAPPCRGPEGAPLSASGTLLPLPGGGLIGQYGAELVVYDEDPLAVRSMLRPSRATLVLPRGDAGLWVLHPEHLADPSTALPWDPEPGERDPAGCFRHLATLPGDPDDPLAWQVAEALLPSDQPAPGMLPQEVGGLFVHELSASEDGTPERLLLARPGRPPWAVPAPEEPGWRRKGSLQRDPETGDLVLAAVHPSHGYRLRALAPETGEVRWRLALAATPAAAPVLAPPGLFLFVDGGVLRIARELLVGEVDAARASRLDLAGQAGWIPAFLDRSSMAWAPGSGLHLVVAHEIPPGAIRAAVPVLSWYPLGDALDPRAAGTRPLRLEASRPGEALFVSQRVQVGLQPLPGRDDQALLDLVVGWSRYEVLHLDLARGRVLSRVDTRARGELGDNGYFRARPRLASRPGGPRAVWLDSWGTLHTWALAEVPGDPPEPR